MTRFEAAKDIRIRVPRAALCAIFDECDRYNHDETGGRVLGTADSPVPGPKGNREVFVHAEEAA